MHVMRIADAPSYEAPGHYDMTMRRIQGREAGPSDTVWMGMSVIASGGGTTFAASPVEKFYVVLHGELEVTVRARWRRAGHALGASRLLPHLAGTHAAAAQPCRRAPCCW